MEAAGTFVVAAPSPGSILHHPSAPGGCRLVMGAVWLSEKRTPVRPNSNSAEFRTWVVLNYSSYVVLGKNWP